MELHNKETKTLKEWRSFSNASSLKHSYDILQDDRVSETEYQYNPKRTVKGSHADVQPTDTESYEVVCIHSPDKEESITYLVNKKKPKDEKEEKQCMLLIDGSINTHFFDWDSLGDFFQGQIEADRKAFRLGRIYYPIYEMLSIVSKLIKHRETVYSVIFTGERKVSYKLSCRNEHTIKVNPEERCFMINNSETKYIEYLPAVSKDNLWDIRKEICYKFADRLGIKMASILDSGKIKETWKNCEVTVYIDELQLGYILIGRGEKEPEKRQIVNYVGGEVTSSPETKL